MCWGIQRREEDYSDYIDDDNEALPIYYDNDDGNIDYTNQDHNDDNSLEALPQPMGLFGFKGMIFDLIIIKGIRKLFRHEKTKQSAEA